MQNESIPKDTHEIIFVSLVGSQLAFLVREHVCIKGCGQVLTYPSPRFSGRSFCQQHSLPRLLGNGVSGWGICFCPLEECRVSHQA